MNYADRLEYYKKVVSTFPEIEMKGKTMRYTSFNGHMFSFLSKDGMVCIRLSEKDREQFLATFNTQPVKQHGSVMKEYVEIPVDLLRDTKAFSKYLDKSFAYVSELKPKPATKKKSSG